VCLLVLGCALLLAARAHAQAEGSLRLAGSGGFDTNARRDFLQTGAEPDLVASAVLAARGQWAEEGFGLSGRYDAGARKFLRLWSEDTLIQSAGAEASLPVARAFRVGLSGAAKDRRGERSYSDLLGGAVLEWEPEPRLEVRLEARGHRFIYWPAFDYSFAAPELALSGRFRFDRRHSLYVFGEGGVRRYNARARDIPEASRDLGGRRDVAVSAGAGYSYRGPFTVTVAYGFFSQASNSFGESLQRHRVSVSGALRLPHKLILLGDLAFQVTRYPDGVYLSERFTLQQDDESFNQVSLRLARPLLERLDLELTFALYHTQLPANRLTYLRAVGGVGLAFRI
jgi:hypothetical protein